MNPLARTTGAVVAIPLALVFGGCSSDPPSDPGPPTPQSVVASGRVGDAESGAPVPGATVSIGTIQTTSATDGSYELQNLPTGSRQIQAVAEGFETYTSTLDLQAGENRHDIGMARLKVGSLSGAVLADATDDPVPGAVVRVGGVQTMSGSDGGYELQNVPLGPTELRATADGFNPYLQSLTVQEGANVRDIRMPPQTLFEHGSFALYLPTEVETVRGIFFYQAGRSSDTREIIRFVATGELPPNLPPPPPGALELWTVTLPELASRHGLALLGGLIHDISPVSTASVFGSFGGFAAKTGHPELAGAALLPVGYSFGGCFVGQLAFENPGRIIGFQVLRGSCAVPTDNDGSAGALKSVPAQFLNGGNDPVIGPITRANIQAAFEANRAAGAPWSLTDHPQWTHDITSGDRRVWGDWLDPILEIRLPEEHTGGLIQLRPVDEGVGWLGNLETFEIAPYASYEGEKGAAAWFPSMETAQNWQDVLLSGG